MNLSVAETINALRLCASGGCDRCQLNWSQCDELMPHAAELISKLDVQLTVRKMKDIPMPCTHKASLPGDYTCPMCNNVISERERWGNSTIYVVPNYCPFCGQRVCKEEEPIERKSFCIDPNARFEL